VAAHNSKPPMPVMMTVAMMRIVYQIGSTRLSTKVLDCH
jgi:hypothetical protein